MKPIGRPKKATRYTTHNRTPDGADFGFRRTPFGPSPGVKDEPPTKDELANLHRGIRITTLKRLRMDPMGDHDKITFYMGPILDFDGDEPPDLRDNCRAWLANFVESQTADEVERLFQGIVALKRFCEADPHKNFTAYLAYHNFIENLGREPSRRSLKEYILARPEEYLGMPPKGDTKAWERLWEDCGLADMLKIHGTKP